MAFALHSISVLSVVPAIVVVSCMLYPFYIAIQTSSRYDCKNNFICMLQKAYFIPSNSGNPILEYSPYLSMIPSEIYLPVARLYLKECVLNLIVETFNNTETGAWGGRG